MVFTPWTERAALPPGAPEEAPPKKEKSWWERGVERMGPEGWTWPWEAAHWERPGATAAKWGLGIGLGAAGLAGGLSVAPALAGLSGLPGLGGLTGPALTTMGHPWLMGMGGLGAGLMAPGLFPTGEGEAPTRPTGPPPTAPPGAPGPAVGQTRANYGPTGIPFIEEWTGTEWVRTTEQVAAGPETQPKVMEIGGQQFWWDPTGGMYGTGGWSIIPSRAEPPLTLTPEQQIEMTEEERAHQMAMLQMQYQLEQQAMGGQQAFSRQMQEQAAEQQMQQMYAADPHKYWAQLGTPTPPAVARLQPGVEAGAPATQAPIGTPSAQWWQNLLPSEQQQVIGGTSWMGVDPQDWYSMYQRMIPGMGARQMGPVWAR